MFLLIDSINLISKILLGMLKNNYRHWSVIDVRSTK
jgi:hypothetical protein